jgi:plastocyanin
MNRRPLITMAILASLAFAGCGGAAPAASEQPTEAGPTEPSATEPAAADCESSSEAGNVTVDIAGLAYAPAAVTAKVGDVITFTNQDAAPHTATLDDGGCETERLAKGDSGSLTFAAAGTYPFHCAIHASMTGTIEITQ